MGIANSCIQLHGERKRDWPPYIEEANPNPNPYRNILIPK